MARSSIELIVDASNAINPLKRVTAETRKLDGAVRDANGRLRDAKGKFVGVGTGANEAAGGLRNFNSGLGSIKQAIGGIGLGLLTKQVVGAAASFNSLQLRLKLLTQQYGETEQAQEVIARSAKKFGLSNREAAQGVTDIFARLRPLGVSLKDIESTFVGFNTVAKLSGVESQQASAAFTQLAQALGSGRLQGDEFRSIAEQIPGLLTAVSDVTGIAQGKLKEFASDGLLTSDIIIEALRRAEKDGGAAIAQIIKESDVQKFKDFQNATDDLAIAVGDALLPVVIPAAKAITDLVNGIAKIPAPAGQAALAIGGVALALKAVNTAIVVFKGSQLAAFIGTQIALYKTFGAQITLTAAAQGLLNKALILGKAALLALPFAIVTAALTFYISEVARAKQEQADFNNLLATGTEQQLNQALATEKATLALIAKRKEQKRNAMGGRVGVGDFAETIEEGRTKRRIEKILDTLRKRIANRPPVVESPTVPTLPTSGTDPSEELNKRKDISVKMNELLMKQQQIRFSTNEIAKSQIEKEIRLQKIKEDQLMPMERARKEDEAKNDHLEKVAAVMRTHIKLAADNNKVNLDGMRAVFKEGEIIDAQIQKQAEKMDSLYKSIGDTISSGIVDSLTAAVDGTKSLAEVASNTLKSLANIMLRFGLQTFLGGLGGGNKNSIFTKLFGGGMASGGTVTGGRSFVVGERGPELFTPGRTGSIAPNSSMGATSIVVNVDANNTNAQGDNQNGKRLGAAIGAAVQAELVKQKRPGGLLAS